MRFRVVAASPLYFPFLKQVESGRFDPRAALNDVGNRLGIDPKTGQFNIGTIGAPNGGLITTVGAVGTAGAMEMLNKKLGHNTALSRGNLLAIADELVPIAMAAQSASGAKGITAVNRGINRYVEANAAYNPFNHSWLAPTALVNSFLPRLGAKVGLGLARRFLSRARLGHWFSLKSMFRGMRA